MEKNIKIKTEDKKLIYGVLNSSMSNYLIIFVHGLTGHKNEHLFYNSAKFFTKKKYDTFRFDLYSGEKNGREICDCTIKTHCQDLNLVIKYFKKKYEKIFLVGHSLGGPVVLLSNLDSIVSIILWDPSINIYNDLSNEMKFNKQIKKFILKWGVEYLLSKEMIESWKELDDNLLKYFKKPTKIICAGKGILYKDWRKKLKFIESEKDFIIIKNAGHCFDEFGVEEELFIETLKWFNR